MTKKKFFFFSESRSTKPDAFNINSSNKKQKKDEDEDASSSSFRDGLDMFLDLEKFESPSPKFNLNKKQSEGSNQGSQKAPPVKKNQREEELEGSILLVGSLSENPKQKPEDGKEEEISTANVVLKIDQGIEGVSNVVVKSTSNSKSKKFSKNFQRGR